VKACHDGTPIVDYACPACGAESHLHESQLAGAPADADVGGVCSGCGELVTLARADVDAALEVSREIIARPLRPCPARELGQR
jgi:hypothetical protein